jgi:hypothetical protein
MRRGGGGDIFGILGILRLLDRREKEREREIMRKRERE